MKTSSRIAWIVCITSCISCLTVATRAQVCLPEFAEQPGFAVGRNAGTNALVDLNEDGNLDLIIGLTFFLGDGTGLFDTRFRLPATPQVPEGFDVKAADFDLDGHLDLAMVMIGGPHMNFFYGRGYHEDPSDRQYLGRRQHPQLPLRRGGAARRPGPPQLRLTGSRRAVTVSKLSGTT